MISFPTSVFYFLNNTDCKYITCPVFQTLPGWFPSALCRIHSVLCAQWAAQTCEILIPALQWMYWEAQQEIQLNEFNDIEKLKYTCISKNMVYYYFSTVCIYDQEFPFIISYIHNRCLFRQDSSKVLQKHYLKTDYFNCSHKVHFINTLLRS